MKDKIKSMADNIPENIKEFSKEWAEEVLRCELSMCNDFLAHECISTLPYGFLPDNEIFIKDGVLIQKENVELLFEIYKKTL